MAGAESAPPPMRQLPLTMRLRGRAVFDDFLPGANAAAVGQLRAVAAGAAAAPIWLAGPAGAGKTHLLQAVCAERGAAAAYLPLRELRSLGPAALEGWQGADCLCLDELEAVIGRRDWEQALFNLYREAEERSAQLLATAPAPPAQLPFVLPDLATRFAAGLIYTLQPLDEAAQREALQLHARRRGLTLPDETALYLQRRFRRDMTTLYNLLDTLDEAALQAQRRLTIPFIREVLGRR
jgi:DnaA-homolog protein